MQSWSNWSCSTPRRRTVTCETTASHARSKADGDGLRSRKLLSAVMILLAFIYD